MGFFSRIQLQNRFNLEIIVPEGVLFVPILQSIATFA
jgi:hypothetical protein